jgi:hypothetical protein
MRKHLHAALAFGAATVLAALASPGVINATDSNCELALKGTLTLIVDPGPPPTSYFVCYGNPSNCCRSN